MERDVYNVDASGQVLGRMATDIAMHLMGKHKPSFESHIDAGDLVVVTNIKDVKISGNKVEQKVYYHHTGHPGGIKTTKMRDLMEDKPEEVLHRAVSRMLPKNKHRTERLKRLLIT